MVSQHHSLQYFLTVSEIETWVEEKWPLASSQEYGGDETATFGLIRKHQVLCPDHPHVSEQTTRKPATLQRAHPASGDTEPCCVLPEHMASPVRRPPESLSPSSPEHTLCQDSPSLVTQECVGLPELASHADLGCLCLLISFPGPSCSSESPASACPLSFICVLL